MHGTYDLPEIALGDATVMRIEEMHGLITTHLPQLHGPHALLGTGAPPADLAPRMHAAWTSFAHTDDPGWATYDTERRATMRIAQDWTLTHDPRAAERQAWHH
ncbi:hypothetical protein ACFWBC_05555 [Streptomyces sp. NPDC059985]|uniref:hypothetical protein n=1 Tax=Streptomyces sp. NPDC059985 TaxID=3347025 RepID=UPI003692E017